jgi:hypothetical protein
VMMEQSLNRTLPDFCLKFLQRPDVCYIGGHVICRF